MTALRDPDPTLTALPCVNEDGDLTVVAVTGLGDSGEPQAHRDRSGLPPGHPCRDVGWSPTPHLTVEQAAYISVPCRECFPDAPPAAARAHEDRIVNGLASEVARLRRLEAAMLRYVDAAEKLDSGDAPLYCWTKARDRYNDIRALLTIDVTA